MGFLSTIVSGAAVLRWWILIFLYVTCICYGLFIKVSNHTVGEQNRNNIRRLGRLITNSKQREKTRILLWAMGQGLWKPSFSSWLGQRRSWASEKLLFCWQAKESRDEITCQFVYLNSKAFHQRTVPPTHSLWKQVKKYSTTIHMYYAYSQGEM